MSFLSVGIKSLALSLTLFASSSLFAGGLKGVPSEISGESDSQVPERAEGKGVQLGEYVREQVDGIRIQPKQVKPTQAEERFSGRVTPVQPLNKPGERPDEKPLVTKDESEYGNRDDYHEQPVIQRKQVRFVLPEGMNVIKKNSDGAAAIDGDKPGTYLVKVPPLLFSRIVLPFEAEVTTPFPDQVVIKHNQGSLLVAPKSVMPVNLVIYHPQKPEVSIGIVLMPDSQEIPATIQVDFDASRLPEIVGKDDGVSNKITSLGIASRINDRDARKAIRFEKSGDHISVLEGIHRLVSQGLVPDGFSLEVVTEGVTGSLCSDRRLIGEFTQRMRGERFTVDVFSVANAHNDYVSFSEENCYRRGVASVQFFPSRNLAPGKTAELVIVHANDDEEAPRQQRRPTQVRLDR